MGNQCIYKEEDDDTEMINNQERMSPEKASSIITSGIRRGNSIIMFKRKLIERLKEVCEENGIPVEINELSIKDFNQKIESNQFLRKILTENSNLINSINYEGIESTYQIIPFKIKNIKTNYTQYYFGSLNIKSEFCGLGTLFLEDGTFYKGLFRSNTLNGTGFLVSNNGDYYYGDFVNGKCEGKGMLVGINGNKYEGEFRNNFKNGIGKEENDNEIYFGNFVDGKREGEGKMTLKNGNSYEGHFRDSLFDGEGQFHWQDGRIYKGNFEKGEMKGKGTHRWVDGSLYSGEYSFGKRQGNGLFQWPNGNQYSGNWINGVPHGNGDYLKGNEHYHVKFRFGKPISSYITVKV